MKELLMKRGVAIAGNMLVDHVKTVAAYPAPGMLATIEEGRMAVGGCVPNTAIDLAKMGGVPVKALGRIGRDSAGDYILQALAAQGVDTHGVIRTADATSFSDVIADRSTGERTFFHHRGANAAFSPADVTLDRLDCDLLLLDAFDQPEDECGTVMARFLRDVQAWGIRTSIDVVSDSGGRFRQIVLPALPYGDHVIVNELEGCAVFGIAARAEQEISSRRTSGRRWRDSKPGASGAGRSSIAPRRGSACMPSATGRMRRRCSAWARRQQQPICPPPIPSAACAPFGNSTTG